MVYLDYPYMSEAYKVDLEQKDPEITKDQTIGKVRGIAEGKDGTRALALSIDRLCKDAETFRKKRDGLRTRVESFKKFAVIPAWVVRFAAHLEEAEGEFNAKLSEVHEASERAYAGILEIERAVDAYIQTTREFKAAKAVKEGLLTIRNFAAMCLRTQEVMEQKGALGKQGRSTTLTEAKALFKEYAVALGKSCAAYQQALKNAPSRFSELPTEFDLGTLDKKALVTVRDRAGSVSPSAIQDGIDAYAREQRDEFLKGFPKARFTEQEKEFFKERTDPQWMQEEHEEVPEDNP